MGGSLGINPDLDIAGRIGNECFLCAKPIVREPVFYAPVTPMAVELPAHLACFDGRDMAEVAREYHRRIHDLANVARMH